MKRIFLTLLLGVTTFTLIHAQTLLKKIPAHASMVVKYSGDNFSKNIALTKVDGYRFVKEQLYKALKIDSLNSLQSTGVDFEKDIYQYASMEDSTMSLVNLFPIKDLSLFLKLLDANYHAEMKPEKMNGYEYLSLSADTYVGWNNDHAVLVMSSYSNPNRYNYYWQNGDTTTAVIQAPVEDIIVEDVLTDTVVVELPPPPPPPPAVKKKSTKPGSKKTPAQKNKTAKAPTKKPVTKEPVEIIDEEVIYDKVEETPVDYEDSLRNAKRDAWYLEQEKVTVARQKFVAGNIIRTAFTGNINSIQDDISYNKVTDPKAHLSVWFNYENILQQYWASLYRGFYPFRSGVQRPVETKKENDGFRSAMNIYFEKDKMRIDQRSFSPDEKMANLGTSLFSSKQSKSLANYVNPGNIGYLSMSINSEAMATYYYKLIRQYMNNTAYIAEYSDVVDVYIDLLEIIIDEKAISDLMPGNYMFVLHDMKTRQVSYTDYEYDDDFKTKEVKKTKQELSPNFTFVMETKKEGFMQKLVNLPLKYAKKENFNYQDRGGYYEFVFEEGKYPLSSLYFMVNNGKLIVTTSKASIDMTLNNTGYDLDKETKNSILDNNYSLKINSKKLLEQVSTELNSGLGKKISMYLEENVGDIKMESRIKDGMIQGTTTMNISGTHANSLEFFFNMIDSINTIMEKDKEEKEQKLN